MGRKKTALEKINEAAEGETSGWREKARRRLENRKERREELARFLEERKKRKER